MLITKLKSKLHKVTATDTNLHYEGSCAIDSVLMEAANIQEYEQIHIYNVNNGNRFTTYAIAAEPDSGIISVRGSAARLAMTGDILIICTYGLYNPHSDDANNKPLLVYVNLENQII